MKNSDKTDQNKRWEPEGDLGQSRKHAHKVSDEDASAIDSKLGLQAISVRLQIEIIEALKAIAKKKGIGYQPLIRMILNEYVGQSVVQKSKAG